MRERRQLFRLVTAVTGVLVAFAIVEAGVRVYKRDVAFQPDPDMIRSRRPRVAARVVTYETDDLLNSCSQTVPARPTLKGMDYTNNVGLRMEADVRPKVPGERRLLLLGDSFVEASSVPDHQRFYRLLDEQLNKATLGHWRVINAAIMGGAPSQYILQLRRYLDEFQPDLVIVALAPNDVTEDCQLDREYGFVRDEQGYPIELRRTFELWLLQKSWALRYVETALSRASPRLHDAVFPDADGSLSCPDWVGFLCGKDANARDAFRQTTGRYLLKLKDMTDARRAPFGVFLIHYEWEFENEPWHRATAHMLPAYVTRVEQCDRNQVHFYNQFVQTFLSEHGVDFWDPDPAIRAAKTANPKRKLWNYDDYHFSPAGHQLMAGEMLAFWKRITERIPHD